MSAPPPPPKKKKQTTMEGASNDSIAALYAVRLGVGLCSSLSVLGACAIILSYAAFPELRTVTRQMLLNLSIADILLSLAFLLGLIQNADTFENPYHNNGSVPYWLCETQAFIIICASDSAILWTISIAAYFFITIALQRPRHAVKLLPAFYVFSWGVSLSVSLWLAITNSLGYEPGTDPAFCGILSTVEENGERVDADYPILAGYAGWNYLAFFVLPVLFISTMCRNKQIVKAQNKEQREMSNLVSPEDHSDTSSTTGTSSSSRQFKHRIKLSEMADKKVVIVPVVYMLLKFWGLAADIAIYFVSTHARSTYRRNAFSSVLVFVSGIGASLPGFVHGLLFCALTKEVRETMVKGIWSGLTNCEICIYDRSCRSACCKRQKDNAESEENTSGLPHEILNGANHYRRFNTFLTDKDIIQSPDPTSSVSITHSPTHEVAGLFAEFEDDIIR